MPPRVRPPLRRSTGDDGFTLVEALVSLTLLGVVSAATLTALAGSTSASKGSNDRLIAANLAQQDLQAMQSLRYPQYPTDNPACTVVVGGTTFSVTRTVTDYATPSTSAAPTTAAPSTSAPTTTAPSTTPASTATGTKAPTTSVTPTTSATPSATPSTTAAPAGQRANVAAPTICQQPATSAAPTPTPTTSALAPCPAKPNYDARTYMVVSTTVKPTQNPRAAITLKALIAC